MTGEITAIDLKTFKRKLGILNRQQYHMVASFQAHFKLNEYGLSNDKLTWDKRFPQIRNAHGTNLHRP